MCSRRNLIWVPMRMQFGLDIRLVNISQEINQGLQANFFPYKAIFTFHFGKHKRLWKSTLALVINLKNHTLKGQNK